MELLPVTWLQAEGNFAALGLRALAMDWGFDEGKEVALGGLRTDLAGGVEITGLGLFKIPFGKRKDWVFLGTELAGEIFFEGTGGKVSGATFAEEVVDVSGLPVPSGFGPLAFAGPVLTNGCNGLELTWA